MAVRTTIYAHSDLQACSDSRRQSATLQIWRPAPFPALAQVCHYRSDSRLMSSRITVGAGFLDVLPVLAYYSATMEMIEGLWKRTGAGEGHFLYS